MSSNERSSEENPTDNDVEDSKIESMASLFILGGFIPICGSALETLGFSYDQESLRQFAEANCAFFFAIVSGFLSLFVKRAGYPWRLIVLIGSIGFASSLASTWLNPIWLTMWSLSILCLIALQFRRDVLQF